MDYIVTKEHVSNYPDPIKLTCGECITVFERYVGPEGWDNWISCISKASGKKGWVPEQIIKIEAENAYVIQDYDATELTIIPGVIVQEIEKLNGWVWCQNCDSGEIGWLPLSSLQEIKNKG
mgnify:CR=1 FL=1